MKPKVMNRFFESIFLLLLIVLIYTLSIISADAQMVSINLEKEPFELVFTEEENKKAINSDWTATQLQSNEYAINRMNDQDPRKEQTENRRSFVLQTQKPMDAIRRFNNDHLHWRNSYLAPTFSFRF